MPCINDLPAEILAHVFRLTPFRNRDYSRNRPGNYLYFGSIKFDTNGAPFVFLHVCGYWRAVAQNTPLLWSSLSARMYDIRTTTATKVLAYLLSLSHNAPLDFLLEALDPRDSPPNQAVALLRTLAVEAPRWRSAALDMDLHLAEVFIDMLLSQHNTDFLPNLTRLELTVFANGVPVESLARAIGTITSLKELYLVLPAGGNSTSLLRHIPLSQLTTIYIYMPLTIDQIVSFLVQSTAAVTVTLARMNGSVGQPTTAKRFPLPKLKHLTMKGLLGTLTLLDYFDFPGLEHLVVESASITNYEPLERFMEQSKPPIRRIFLDLEGDLPGSDIVPYLRIPNIHQVPQVEFSSWNILDIVAAVAAQLTDDMPNMWSWQPWQEMERIGWKSQFDHVDECVTRIFPVPPIL